MFYTSVNELLEADLYLEYGKPVGRVWLFGAASVYNFKVDTAWESTFELYAGATVDTFLQPTIEITRDFDIGDGTLVALSGSHGFPIGTQTLTTTLSLVYNGRYYREGSGIGYLELGFEVPLSLGSGVTFSPRSPRAIARRSCHVAPRPRRFIEICANRPRAPAISKPRGGFLSAK